jgi:hypothetical protein
MIRGFAAAAAVGCAALGCAGPAHADQLLQGEYTYTPQQGEGGTYEIWPSCVPVVGDLRQPLDLPVACRLHIAPSSEDMTGGDANLVGGIWELSSPKKEGMKCPDGSWAPTIETLKVDDATMTGTREIRHTDVCGLQPGIISTPFTLTYQGPLPIPNDQYPLWCEPGGWRICR